MIGKLKKIIKKKTYRVVARELGYNSGSTVLHWVNNKKIPSNIQILWSKPKKKGKPKRATGFYWVVLSSYWNVAYYCSYNDHWLFHHLERALKDKDLDRIHRGALKTPEGT